MLTNLYVQLAESVVKEHKRDWVEILEQFVAFHWYCNFDDVEYQTKLSHFEYSRIDNLKYKLELDIS